MNSPVRAGTKSVSSIRAPRRRPLSLASQLRAILPVLILLALLIVLTLLFVWVPFRREIAADPSPVVKALLSAQFFRIQLVLAPLLLISEGVAAVYALLQARRVAGPLQDLREGLARLALGDAEPLAMQAGAEFRELEANFNAVVSRFDQRARLNLEMLHLLRRNLDGIAQRSTNHQLTDADLRESIAVLLRDIDAEIKKFQMRA
jgi:hypothetical protein